MVSIAGAGGLENVTRRTDRLHTAGKDMLIDPYVDLLHYKIMVLDRLLINLEKDAEKSPDPDTFGICDTIDDVTGFGFVACQKYIRAIFNAYKTERNAGFYHALGRGPKHDGGEFFARLIHECANYWKHCDEWRYEKRTPQQESTHTIIKSLNIDVLATSYPMIDALTRIVRPREARFSNVLPMLSQWKYEVYKNRDELTRTHEGP